MSKWARRGKAPKGFELLEGTLSALDAELSSELSRPVEGQRKCESLWPVHQVNWQKSRYVFDMFYKYKRIDKSVYDYCVNNKIVDGALMSKWRKPGYERLCSTFVINPRNYPYGTVSICRVPRSQLSEENKDFRDQTTGCRGCASGEEGFDNIFGNKFGQRLAEVQILREKHNIQGTQPWMDQEEAKRIQALESTHELQPHENGETIGSNGDTEERLEEKGKRKRDKADDANDSDSSSSPSTALEQKKKKKTV